ncbi:MAG: helix-turn-helix domain-containing protein [Fimbriimonadaceae bacterium]
MEGNELSLALGRVVRRLRTEQGYSQENFAYHSGIHRTFMGMIERGQRNVTLATIFRLAKGLNVPASALIAEVERDEQQAKP